VWRYAYGLMMAKTAGSPYYTPDFLEARAVGIIVPADTPVRLECYGPSPGRYVERLPWISPTDVLDSVGGISVNGYRFNVGSGTQHARLRKPSPGVSNGPDRSWRSSKPCA